ncbi:40S ribosomal protein S5-1 [Hordeum vulgare]|nr:40S ribosomal protein S5-1 [Hordeum vulgare]
MTSPKAPKDKIFEKVINPYLTGVLQHPQSNEMCEGMLHIRDVEGPKKTGSVETRLEAMEQQVFKCQGMVERGLNANHMMITEFTNKHMIDANDIGKHLYGLYDRIDQLHAQIYDLQNQNLHLTPAWLDAAVLAVIDVAPGSARARRQALVDVPLEAPRSSLAPRLASSAPSSHRGRLPMEPCRAAFPASPPPSSRPARGLRRRCAAELLRPRARHERRSPADLLLL